MQSARTSRPGPESARGHVVWQTRGTINAVTSQDDQPIPSWLHSTYQPRPPLLRQWKLIEFRQTLPDCSSVSTTKTLVQKLNLAVSRIFSHFYDFKMLLFGCQMSNNVEAVFKKNNPIFIKCFKFFSGFFYLLKLNFYHYFSVCFNSFHAKMVFFWLFC